MGRPWYSFYPSDYARDTGHLTLIEHGAYRALMDHYYATAAPLPRDIERLLRLCRARAPAEKAAVRFVLAEFFVAEAEGFRHKRIEAEIEKAEEHSLRGAIAGKISATRRQQKANRKAVDGATKSQPSHSQPQSEDKDSKGTAGFEEFWSAYPRREAKGAARRAYAKAAGGAATETLIAGARAYAARRQGQDPAFTRLAATWLAQECWLDDAPVSESAAVDAGALRAAWAGRAAPLVDEIGAAAFQAYFGEADFSPGPPVRIVVAAPYLRDLIARKFPAALRRAFGECALEIAA